MDRPEPAVVPIRLGIVSAFLISGGDAAVLVDTGFRGSQGRILKAASAAGIEPEHISLIVLTHGHSDHFGSAAPLRRRTGAPIAIHTLDAHAMRQGANPPLRPMTGLGRLLLPVARIGELRADPAEPDILLDGDLDLAAYGVDGRLIHTPGHTPGSMSVVLPGGDVIVGDLLMGGLVRPHRPDYPFVGDDRAAIDESIGRILDLAPRRILTSHGGPLDPAAVQRRFLT
jgi:hydroxyacylglutathione hydrolase